MPSGAMQPIRVVSLLPSATEIFASLVQEWKRSSLKRDVTLTESCPLLVGRSHECDYPPDLVAQVPILTAAKTTFTSSLDTHHQVQHTLAQGSSLYHLNSNLLHQLQPHIILTQDTCNVCSIDVASVQQACPSRETRIVTVPSQTLEDALIHSVYSIGKAVGLERSSEFLVKKQQDRFHRLIQLAKEKRAQRNEPVRVMVMEWLEPVFLGSGWTAELVDKALALRIGGTGRPSSPLDEQGLDVDILIISLCGLNCELADKELSNSTMIRQSWWTNLKAVQDNNVFIVDGNSMFHRPTHRLLDAFEWLLCAIYHPENVEEAFPDFPAQRWSQTRGHRDSSDTVDIEDLHQKACLNKENMYQDPKTGYSVLTAHFLKERKICCGNACRHCPYGHVNVKDAGKRINKIAANVYLKKPRAKAGVGVFDDLIPPSTQGHSVVFWSGGKDSLLALEHTMRTKGGQVTLLTTVDPESNVVNIQNIPVSTITEQAKALNLPLYLVPVPAGSDYTQLVKASLEELVSITRMPIDRLVFGDLHLQDIREWREEAFSDYPLDFPLFNRSIQNDLLPRLFQLVQQRHIRIRLSHIESNALDRIFLKMEYNQEFISHLPDSIDKMGEKGEFHTCVEFIDQ